MRVTVEHTQQLDAQRTPHPYSLRSPLKHTPAPGESIAENVAKTGAFAAPTWYP